MIVEKYKYKEWLNFTLKIFFSKYNNAQVRTKKDFLKIIKNFIEYAPDLNPEELESFMEYKFKISDKENLFKASYS